MMVFCKVLMAIPLFTSLLSSSMLQFIQTLFIDVSSSTNASSSGSGWLSDNLTSYGIHIVALCLLCHSGAKISVLLSVELQKPFRSTPSLDLICSD